MAARYSKAVVELAAAASAFGDEVSPRQIERWRQAHVIPNPEREFRGRGSTAAYAEEAARQTAEVAKLLSEGWRLKSHCLDLQG